MNTLHLHGRTNDGAYSSAKSCVTSSAQSQIIAAHYMPHSDFWRTSGGMCQQFMRGLQATPPFENGDSFPPSRARCLFTNWTSKGSTSAPLVNVASFLTATRQAHAYTSRLPRPSREDKGGGAPAPRRRSRIPPSAEVLRPRAGAAAEAATGPSLALCRAG